MRCAPTGVSKSVRKTCKIFINTTSSLLGSVPTNRACVTASARLSIPEGVLSEVGSIKGKFETHMKKPIIEIPIAKKIKTKSNLIEKFQNRLFTNKPEDWFNFLMPILH